MKINSKNIDNFFVFSNTLEPILKEYITAVVIPLNIKNENELFGVYASLIQGLCGPFGDNWNALMDALRGFDLMDYRLKEIVILHQDIPIFEIKQSLRVYIHCLVSSHRFWEKDKKEPIRELKIVFPTEAKEKILEIMKDYEIDLPDYN